MAGDDHQALTHVVEVAADIDLDRARSLVDRVQPLTPSLLIRAQRFDDALTLAQQTAEHRWQALLNVATAAAHQGHGVLASKAFDLAFASAMQQTDRTRGWALRDVARDLPDGDERLPAAVSEAMRVADGERSMVSQLAPFLAKAGDLAGAHAALRRFKGGIELRLAIARATAQRSRSESGETHRAIEQAIDEARALPSPRWSVLAQVSIASVCAELGNGAGARSILLFASEQVEAAQGQPLATRVAMFEELLAAIHLMRAEQAAFARAWSWLEQHAELVATFEGLGALTSKARAAVAHAHLGQPAVALGLLVEALDRTPKDLALEPHFELWLALDRWPLRTKGQ